MKVAEIFITTLFSAWLLITILLQFRVKKINRIKYYDLFSMIPSWTFFAPNPGVHDHHLVYRDKYTDGSFSYWIEVPMRPTKKFIALWNPHKRRQKSLADAVAALMAMKRENPEGKMDHIIFSLPYLAIINFISGLDHSPLSEASQFCLVKTPGYERQKPSGVAFVSKFHNLETVHYDSPSFS